MPTPRKKKTLTKPFVMTIAQVATAMLTPGCFSTVTSNPPGPDPLDPTCPATMPAGGSACSDAITCDYGMDECGLPLSASCDGSIWSVNGPVICNPPPPDPECPVDLPALGSTCNWNWQSGFGCSYMVDNGCGMQSISVMCDPNTTTVQYTAPTCGQCSTLTSEGACNSDGACRWLTPGCGMPALPAAGCFPVMDCAADTDCTTPGQTCQDMSYNPCYMQACNACGAQAKVCLTPEP